MDIDSLTKGIGLVSNAIKTLKSLKELIPSGDKKQDVEQKLEEAEKNIKIAEAKLPRVLINGIKPLPMVVEQ